MVIILNGKLETLDLFAYEMAKGMGALVVDVKDPKKALLPVIDDIDQNTVVITFNGVGAGFGLWEEKNVRLYNIMVDHPAYYLEQISSDFYPGYHGVCIDRGHTRFLKETFRQAESSFLFVTHGGIKTCSVCDDKDIDVVYAGTFRSDDEINFVPTPYGDSERFYDSIISYYNDNTYVEAQDAVDHYAKSRGVELTIEQRAVLTNYAVRSVEFYFTANRRKTLIRALAKEGINLLLLGTPLWKEVAAEFPDNVIYEGMKDPKEVLDYIGRAKILINDSPYFAEGAHERIFNGMLNGAVVLSNESRYLEERFKDNESILLWDGKNYDEAVAKVKQVLSDEDIRRKIADKALELSSDDTWSNRLKEITAFASEQK